MRMYARSERGRTRQVNQDRYTVEVINPARGLYLLAVADGMGGHLAGEVASEIAIDTLRARIKEMFETDNSAGSRLTSMRKAFFCANNAVVESSKDDGHHGMGTTLTAALVDPDRICVGHVGDCRAYVLKDGKACPITSDHSVVGEMIRKGDLSYEQAMRHPQRNFLTRALGIEDSFDVDIVEIEAVGAKALLLCSDGITGLVTADEIAGAFEAACDGSTVVDSIVELAVERGGYDDATCAVIVFEAPTKGGVMR